MPRVKSVVVIDYYEGIQGMLKSREDFPYKDFLANPRLRTRTDITWSTEAFTGRPARLADLGGALRERYAYALKQRITCIEQLIAHLGEEEGGGPLCELLKKAISYVDEGSVYCADGQVVMVNWGLIPRTPDLGLGSIYRSGKFQGEWGRMPLKPELVKPASAPPVADKLPPSPQITEAGGAEPEPPVAPQPTLEQTVEQPVEQPVAPPPSASEPPQWPDDPSLDIFSGPSVTGEVAEPPVEEQPAEEPVDEPTEEPAEEEKPTDKPAEEEKPADEPKPAPKAPTPPTVNTWGSLLRSFWQALVFLFRRLWWLLLLLILLVVVLFSCRGCQGPVSRINPFYHALPDKSVILPVEKGGVGMSADGLTQIATDRLNILLEQTGEGTMKEWAEAFKRAYPGEDYYIFYYNKELCNLQIKVPASERERLKKELPQKLSGFRFEVYDETVYRTDALTLNDPELKNPSHAWYLGAIGAPDAWQQGLGSEEVVVAVVDNGFDLTHPELRGKVVHPYNVLTQDASIRPVVTSDGENAHGTHVAATAVGACNNASGLLGVAPKCRLMPVQVANDNPEGVMSNQAVLDGVMYAIQQGADVVNVSLGMTVSEPMRRMSEAQQLNFISNSMRQEEYLWSKVYEKARQRNCVIVFAAGNENVIAGIDPKKRSNETIRVSALSTDLTKAEFSNYGRYPNLHREYSTVSAPGVSIYSAAPHGQYVSMNGTSMAAPIVSGAVALLKSCDRNLTCAQIVQLFQQTGREVNPSIGPLIDLGRAVRTVKGWGKGPAAAGNDCDRIAEQVRQLQARIDSLKRLCPAADCPDDTLKYDDAVKDGRALDGTWKTTTELCSGSDESPLEIYMEFHSLRGQLSIHNKGLVYTAPLFVQISGGNILITQAGNATCPSAPIYFIPYAYVCAPDRQGNLFCTATNANGRVEFNLVRVR